MAMDSLQTVADATKKKEESRALMRGAVVILASVVIFVSGSINEARVNDQNQAASYPRSVDLPVTDSSTAQQIDLSSINLVEVRNLLGNKYWQTQTLQTQRSGEFGLSCDTQATNKITAGKKVQEFVLIDVETGQEIIDSLSSVFANEWQLCAERGSTTNMTRVYTNGTDFVSVSYVLGNGNEAAVSIFVG